MFKPYRTIPAVLAAAALVAPAAASAEAFKATPICAHHNYGTKAEPHNYIVTSPNASCATVSEVIHQTKYGLAKGYIYQRPTQGWTFVSSAVDKLIPNRAVLTYERDGQTMTIVAQYVS